MKLIKPNNINIQPFTNKANLLTTPLEAISKFFEIDKKLIQHIGSERNSSNTSLLRCYMHPFIQAIHYSYSFHLALNITPDIIWYLISNAAATHINIFLPKLRNKYSNFFHNKEKINLKRDNFVSNSLNNPWNDILDDFSSELTHRTHKEIGSKIMPDFSTTNKFSRIMSQIVLTDSIQKYFEFNVSTLCGIPEIRVAGTKQDWLNIKSKTKSLFDLMPEFSSLMISLNEILNNFIDVFDDKIDCSFWNNIYKIEGCSGGPFISGWSIVFFPYLAREKANWVLSKNLTWKNLNGITTNSFFYHLNQVPFVYENNENQTDMLFIGGMIGIICEEKDDSLTPIFGYAVTIDDGKRESIKALTVYEI
jgi:hypothetical protein